MAPSWPREPLPAWRRLVKAIMEIHAEIEAVSTPLISAGDAVLAAIFENKFIRLPVLARYGHAYRRRVR